MGGLDIPAPTVLVVESAPAATGGSGALERALPLLPARRGAGRVERWYLRSSETAAVPPGAWVVDELRRWRPARWLSDLGLLTAAGKVRAVNLRLRLRRLRPDVVVLVDRAGEELVRYLPGAPALVDLHTRPSAEGRLPPRTALRATSAEEPPAFVFDGLVATDLANERHRREVDAQRAALGLAEVSVLVEGWGDDGWLDHPDAFVRALWYLERRHGVVAHGIWSGLTDPADERRLLGEAERCGVADRLHLRPSGVGQPIGDAVLLTHRTPRPDIVAECLPAMLSGTPVVAFSTSGAFDPAMRSVRPLDVAALARTVVEELAVPRSTRRTELIGRWSAAADRLLDDLMARSDDTSELPSVGT